MPDQNCAMIVHLLVGLSEDEVHTKLQFTIYNSLIVLITRMNSVIHLF